MARKIAIKPLDRLFSLYIRSRDKWCCQRCGKKYTPPTKGLHCAHGLGRRSHTTRWHEENAVAACYGCHSLMDSNPDVKWEVFDKKFGEGSKLRLERFKQKNLHSKVDKEKIRKELKEKLSDYEV